MKSNLQKQTCLIPEKLPSHIAVIMDGNGRWARARMLPRAIGHREGVKSVRRVVEATRHTSGEEQPGAGEGMAGSG